MAIFGPYKNLLLLKQHMFLMQNWLKNSKMALKLQKKYLIFPQNTKNEGNVIFFSFFFLLGTIDKNAAICRTIGGHIQTQCILSFQMVPESGSHLLALLRYEEKVNRALMKFLLKITFLTKFSQNTVGKCPFFDRKNDFWQK